MVAVRRGMVMVLVLVVSRDVAGRENIINNYGGGVEGGVGGGAVALFDFGCM